MRFLICFSMLSLPGTAYSATTTIYDVVNYGSRTGTGLPGSGVAQGALFAITGSNLGPDPVQQAAFPLPTTDGLGGVAVTIKTAAGTTNAIMVNAGAYEVDAILPSSTPLGPATITLSYAGATASMQINVVASAFGVFTAAGIYNVAADGTLVTNSPFQSAQPGQTVMINGTGLGAIASDETQPGVTDTPTASITVWVGTRQATVVSAGRGACCTGIDPKFPIPQGLAAWDVIAFTIPDGVEGCQVSIAVQTPSSVSNVATFSVASAGGACLEASQVNGGNPVTVSGVVKTALINMTHLQVLQNIGTTSISTISETATAIFYPADYGPNPITLPSYSAFLQGSAGSCIVTASRFDRSITVTPPPSSGGQAPTLLDAGTLLTITAPKVTQIMKLQKGLYLASGLLTSIGTIPGVPPILTGGPSFLVPGMYTLDNGGGGADIGPFTATLRNPTPVTWDSMAQNATIVRSQGVTVKWSGGDPDGVLAITGFSTSTQGNIIYSGLFTCFAKVRDGQFTVPSFITQQLPASFPATGSLINLDAIIADLPTIPGVDVTYYFAQQSVGTSVVFQ